MDSSDYCRYQRQIKLSDWGEEKQKMLHQSRVLVIGAGGLSCPMLLYLSSCGVGRIGIVDGDLVSESNLHRQVLYTPNDVGLNKASVAKNHIQKLNPKLHVVAYSEYVNPQNIGLIIKEYDIIADGTDNFSTRYLINDAAVLHNKTLIHAAVSGWEGQLAVFNYPLTDSIRSANYRHLFPDPPDAKQIPNCSELGIIGTSSGIMGMLQAQEVLKCIVKDQSVHANKLLVVDLKNMNTRTLNYSSDKKIHIEKLKWIDNQCPAFMYRQEFELTPNHSEFKEIKKHALWIDVRTKEEHLSFDPIHGENHPNISVKNIYEIKTNSNLVFYCQKGNRSRNVTRAYMERFPDQKVYSLFGGIESLRSEEISELRS